MQNKLAPIGLSTYARLQHLEQTIAALQKNNLAKESELYIFSDAAKVGDEEKVNAVRRFIRSVDGFKAVHIIERVVNNRVANNRGGIQMLLNKYGKIIFLEEDIVTAPTFLSFMNEALNSYNDDSRIFAVNAYTPPITIPDDYQSHVILLPRFAAWGFGIWKAKYEKIIMDITPYMYKELRTNRKEMKAYCLGGNDSITQLWLQANEFIDALDVRIDYTMFIEGRQYVVCPTKSLAHTTGCDGSGEHWVQATTKYNTELNTDLTSIGIELDIRPDSRIISQLSAFNALTFKGHLVKFAMNMGIYPKWKSLKQLWR